MNPSSPMSAVLVAYQMHCPSTESCLEAPAQYVPLQRSLVAQIGVDNSSKLTA
jgi:hypothetical protein